MHRLRNLIPLLLGYTEILLGLAGTVWAIWTVRPIHEYPDPMWWAAHIFGPILFLALPGLWLIRRERTRWLPQLAPGVIFGLLLEAMLRKCEFRAIVNAKIGPS